MRDADDHRALQLLSRNAEVTALATNPGAVRLLWEVCQIPDFRKVMSDSHARLLAHCFRAPRRARASGCRAAWVGGQMAQLDRLDGDIDTLMARIAHIRTWTYITHRGDWVEDAADWQERARGIEDRLSDALHDSITQRFVDRRSAFLVRQLAGEGELLASVDKEGEVRVEGAYVGRLDGFRFVPDAVDGEAMRTLIAAANRVLRGEVAARARRLAADADEAFAIDAARRAAVARRSGRPAGGRRDDADAAGRGAGRRFSRRRGARAGAPAAAAFCRRRDRAPAGAAVRGAGLAARRRRRAASSSSWSTRSAACRPPRSRRRSQRSTGRPGAALGPRSACGSAPRASISSRCCGPETVRFRALLWAVRHGRPVPPLPGARRHGKAIAVDPDLPASFYAAIGRRVVGGWRCGRTGWSGSRRRRAQRARGGPFAADAELAAIAGVAPAALRRVLLALGYRAVIEGDAEFFVGKPRRRDVPASKRGRAAAAATDIPLPS